MRSYVVSVMVVLGVAGVARGQAPQTLGYNGVLFSCGPGEVGCEGYSYQGPMTFRLWDDEVSVDPLHLVWEETHAEVRVEWGYFHVELGSVTAFPGWAFLGPRWLEVQVGDDEPLAPRTFLGAAPWAFSCVNAQALGGQGATAYALSGHTHGWGEIMGKPGTYPPSVHSHAWGDLTGVPAVLGDGQVGWEEVTGKPSSYPPAGHQHAIGDVTGLQAALDSKSPTTHDHDGRYYQKHEVDAALAAKEDVGVCYTKAEVQQMLAALRAEILAEVGKACPSDMVKVGDFCVDRYEASIWERKDGQPVDCKALQDAVDAAVAAGWTESDIYYGTHTTCGLPDKPAMCSYRQYGSPPGCSSDNACDDYPAEFPDSGNWTKPLYACAVKGVMPSRSMTWFQAQQACGLSGKRIITNAEWQMAVAGTVDPGEHNGSDGSCNTKSGGPRKTGLGTKCVSKWGVEDMIGNLMEWVDLWGQAGRTKYDVDGGKFGGGNATPWRAEYGDGGDITENINGTVDEAYVQPKFGLPVAAVRGGIWAHGKGAGAFAFNAAHGPSAWRLFIGSRCAKGL